MITLSVPLDMPTPQRCEELYLQAAREAVAKRDTWLSKAEAAAYLRMSPRSFDRKRIKWGLPVADLDGTKVFLRADLDAIAAAHLSSQDAVIDFPSQQAKNVTPFRAA